MSQEINWQEAVARLAQERTQAETGVRLLKKHGNAAAIDRGALAYGEAKAEYDGIIAGLVVALAQRGRSRPALRIWQERLQRGLQNVAKPSAGACGPSCQIEPGRGAYSTRS